MSWLTAIRPGVSVNVRPSRDTPPGTYPGTKSDARRTGKLRYRPRSIFSLILIGFAVVMAPLIAAVVTAVIQVDRLAQESRAALIEGEIASRQSRSLVEQLIEMQRALTQYQVLHDATFHRTYLERRNTFLHALEQLIPLNLTQPGHAQLLELRSNEQQFYQQLHSKKGEPVADLAKHNKPAIWASLTEQAHAVLQESSLFAERQIDATTARAAVVQRTLLLQAAAIIPVVLVLAGLFVMLIVRPMREIGRAIHRLGSREFDTPVVVHGPRDLEALGRQLDWLRLRIHELEQQKINFLRHISHELKTPLTTLREGSELLVESLAERSPEDAEISRIMCENSLHLQRLIENLLQFGKTQQIVADLRIMEAVDLQVLVRSVIATQTLASSSKALAITESLLPIRIRCDESKLRIVIDNLVTNAIKYTPTGGRIEVSVNARDEFAVIDVIDNGPGVTEGEKQRIFEPFQQGEAEYQSSVKGTGLGLAIAKEYVEAHDGYIEVVDSVRGAHFRAVLPLAGPSGFPPN